MLMNMLIEPLNTSNNTDVLLKSNSYRELQEESGGGGELWQAIYVSVIIVLMLIALISEKIAADMVMALALALFMIAGIVTIEEGLIGFSNEGILTVVSLFVVAEGINRTGALDWYMAKLLGRPKTLAMAQLRLLIPIITVSAFLNNTPVVAIGIPIVQKWAATAGISAQQLLIPLSYAAILGGTCTLIGTSTNLVVSGLYQDRYPNEPPIGLFDLGRYGVPCAIAGAIYIMLFSSILLPGGLRRSGAADKDDSVLLGARLTKWSLAAGRSVKRSGLRDTGGVYLVSVKRSATGNVHRAVGQDFILNVGDILYFAGTAENFGEFCEEHGLEVITNEVKESLVEVNTTEISANQDVGEAAEALSALVGTTKRSLSLFDDDEKIRVINKMRDLIRGFASSESDDQQMPKLAIFEEKKQRVLFSDDTKAAPILPPQIVVVSEGSDSLQHIVTVGIDTQDQVGLLLDISKALLRLNLQLHHCEAGVLDQRSLSVWKCEALEKGEIDDEEIWSVLSALLEKESGAQAIKSRGLRVIRASITDHSRLVDKTVNEVNFRQTYKAAIVAIQKADGNVPKNQLSDVQLSPGDILILQANVDSPLLLRPPPDFYEKNQEGRKYSLKGLVSMVRSASGKNLSAATDVEMCEPELNKTIDEEEIEKVWKDLLVLSFDQGKPNFDREFLAAMEISSQSKLANKSARELGLDQLSSVLLISIERPCNSSHITVINRFEEPSTSQDLRYDEMFNTNEQLFEAIDKNDPLKEGDILWFSGSATGVGDLRKIPGLKSYESDEVKKIEENFHERRLVQAVVARTGPLVGKTVKDVKFRTRYGAAVIAIHREGKRVQEHPGKVKLHAGDVLLLEAGPTFLEKNSKSDRSFALLSEVKDSAPPRLKLFIPALVLIVAMLAIYTAGLASLLVLSMLVSFLMVCLGILSQDEVRDSIDWEIYLTIACAFGIGSALTNSGVAEAVAHFLVSIGSKADIGDAGIYGAVHFATVLISSIVTNNAAAALLFPIAMNAADQTGVDRLLMAYIVMLASSDYILPFGYQTNLMVYGPGKYKTIDYLKFGTPLQFLLWIVTVALICQPSHIPWYVSWIVSLIALAATVLFNTIFKRYVSFHHCKVG